MDETAARAALLLAEELRSAGMPLSAAGVLSGQTSAAERAALEAVERALRQREADPGSLLASGSRSASPAGVAGAISADAPSAFLRAASRALGRAQDGTLAPSRGTATPSIMCAARTGSFTIDSRVPIGAIEAEIGRLAGDVGGGDYTLRMTPEERSGILKEIWAAMLVAAVGAKGMKLTVRASGVDAWPDLEARDFDDDDATALSIPVLQALPADAAVLPARTDGEPLRAASVRRHAAQRRAGVLGRGGRVTRLVEFDPQEPIASRLGRGSASEGRFEGMVLEAMTSFEVGALSRRVRPVAAGPRQSIVTFLAELHSNAFRYARRAAGVRVVRMGKNLLDATSAARRAGDVAQLREYLAALRLSKFNLIEASVSDFGPGMLQGFLSSEPGRAFAELPPGEVVHRLVHERLSSNGGDPNAGYGTIRALEAAANVGAFVSLRTGAQWLVMAGAGAGHAEMKSVPGIHPNVVGTHWTLLYPDPLL